jgi:hypothetical protein
MWPVDGPAKTEEELGTQEQLDARTTRTQYPRETQEMQLHSFPPSMVVAADGNCSVM